jgi:hypothetical protein
LAHTNAARLADRVANGLGSEVDEELLARFLSQGVRLEGRQLQQLDSPSLSLMASTVRDYRVDRVAVIITPALALDGAEINVRGFPVYLSFKGPGPTTGAGGQLWLGPGKLATGIHTITGVLEAQLVRAEGFGAMGSGSPSDYKAIGGPIRIVLPSVDRLFVRQWPSNYPLEIIDSEAEHKLAVGLVLSGGRLTTNNSRGRENQGLILEAEILFPDLDPTLPLALQVDLVGFSQTQFSKPIGGMILSDTGMESFIDGVVGVQDPPRGTMYRLSIAIAESGLIRLPDGSISAQLRIYSSRELALRAGLERFLSVPEIRRTVELNSLIGNPPPSR